jgi:hypothetical protein
MGGRRHQNNAGKGEPSHNDGTRREDNGTAANGVSHRPST